MKKLNNKGFSLVELIIVIAIMAILIGVVGTQVIPYLENSRKAKDNQVLSGINTAGMSTYTSCAGQLNGSYSYKITIENGAADAASTISVYCATDGTLTFPSSAVSSSSPVDQGYGMLAVFESLAGFKSGETNVITSQMTSKDGKKVSQVDIIIPSNAPIYTVITGGNFPAIENK